MGNIFLDDDGIIRGLSISEEAGLSGTYDFRKIRLDSIDNDFGNDLVRGVAKSNRPEILETVGTRDLGHETNEGNIDTFFYFTSGEGVYVEREQLGACCGP